MDESTSSKEEQRVTSGEKKDTPPKEGNADAQAELATAIDNLLETVGSKFKSMSKDIIVQLDAMAARLDELEAQAKANMQNESNRDSAAS